MGWDKVFQIIFQPKSILGFIIAAGIVFLLIGGLLMALATQIPAVAGASVFFIVFGVIFFVLGIGVWIIYITRSMR